MNIMVFALVALWGIVMAMAVMMWVMLRQIGILYERIAPVGALMDSSGPEVGTQSPLYSLQSLNGGPVRVGASAEKAKLVFFLSPTCPVCKQLLPVLASLRVTEGRQMDIVLASDGMEKKHRDFIAKYKLHDYPYVLSSDLGMAYRVQRLPFAVVLDASGIVRAKGLVNNREQLESLLNAHESGLTSIQQFAALKEQGSMK